MRKDESVKPPTTTRDWFMPLGWIHLPISVPGALISGLSLAFCALAFLAVDRHSHSVSDTFFGVFPFIVPAFLLHEWIAAHRSAGKGGNHE